MRMIERNGLKFNCCESTVLLVGEQLPGQDLDPQIMRVISNFGGGIGGLGSACGAVSGAATIYGLLHGTMGDENPEEFMEKREKMRKETQDFFRLFKKKWGHVNCNDLLGVDRMTPEGIKAYEKMKANGETLCNDYVSWTAEKLVELLKPTL